MSVFRSLFLSNCSDGTVNYLNGGLFYWFSSRCQCNDDFKLFIPTCELFATNNRTAIVMGS